MDAEQLAAWHQEQPVLKVLEHIGCNGGITSVTTARIACRRGVKRILELEAALAAYDRVARRLMQMNKGD